MVGFHLGRPDADYLRVHINGRPYHDADGWEVNWLDAEVEVRAGSFGGRFGARLLAGELSQFREQLAGLYAFAARRAVLEATDGQLAVRVEGDGLGNFTAECEALDERGSRLTFTLEFDQTEIPAFLSGLDALLKTYPFIEFKGRG